MKSITIHGVDDQLAARLQQLAEASGTSVNRTIKRLLEERLGMKPRPRDRNREQFEPFLGRWTQAELDEFRQATADMERVDAEDWR